MYPTAQLPVLRRTMRLLTTFMPSSTPQAPSKPKSPTGEMAAYYLQMQPHLFQEAVKTAFARIKEQREADASAERAPEDVTAQQVGALGGLLWGFSIVAARGHGASS